MTEVTAQEFELKITKELPAPREDVFAAWTNPDDLIVYPGLLIRVAVPVNGMLQLMGQHVQVLPAAHR